MARRMTVRKDKSWNSIPANAADVASTGFAWAWGALTLGESVTAMRLLGEYSILPTSAPAAGDECTVEVGIGVMSLKAFQAASGGFESAAAASFPDPGGEPEYPWLYWASHPLTFNGTAIATSYDGCHRWSFDVKSRRIIKPSEALVGVVRYDDIGTGGTPPLTIGVGITRVLLAE